jgi:hypothetical protein
MKKWKTAMLGESEVIPETLTSEVVRDMAIKRRREIFILERKEIYKHIYRQAQAGYMQVECAIDVLCPDKQKIVEELVSKGFEVARETGRSGGTILTIRWRYKISDVTNGKYKGKSYEEDEY